MEVFKYILSITYAEKSYVDPLLCIIATY